MSIGIIFARGDDPDSRLHGREKFLRGGILAAVVANLQNIGVKRVGAVFRQNFSFRLSFRISRQKQAAVSIAQPQDQRIIVLRGGGHLFRGDFRPQKITLHTIPGKRLSSEFMLHRNISRSRHFFQVRQGRGRHLAPDPEPADSKVLQNCLKSAEMVLVRVGQGHDIQMLESAPPEIGRHRFFARVDAIALLLPGKTAERTTPVYQQRLASGRNDKERIALAYIQNRHF